MNRQDEITITLKNYRCFTEEAPATFVIGQGVTSITGPNNSGKSSLFRFLHSFRTLAGELIVAIQNSRSFIKNSVDNQQLFGLLCNRGRVTSSIGPSSITRGAEDCTVSISAGDLGVTISWNKRRLSSIEFDYQAEQCVGFSGGRLRFNHSPETVFIEWVSLLEPFSNCLFIPFIRHILDNSGGDPAFDIQVGKGFVHQWDSWVGGQSTDESERCYDVQKQLARILRTRDIQIRPDTGKNRLHLMIDGIRHNLSDLGAGISQLIISVAHAAVKRPSLLLIDEPENGLHPSLQIELIKTLAQYCEYGVVFATHNFSLARIASDRTNSITIDTNHRPRVTQAREELDLASFVELMTYSGIIEIEARKVLFVEGPSDIEAVEHFLRLLESYEHVRVIHLGGGTTIERPEEQLSRISKLLGPSACILLDSDRENESEIAKEKTLKFIEHCKKYKLRFHVTAKRAIENYFTDEAVKKELGDTAAALAPFEKFEKSTHWRKTNLNGKIARHMKREDIVDTDLGQFLLTLSE